LKSHKFRILAPIVYQCESDDCDTKTTVKAEYKLAADHKIAFKLGSYDPNKILAIDPKIAFGTMLGGNTFDNAADVGVDATGNFYVVGYTEAKTRIPGNGDGFVHKFSPTGALIWTTFLAGSGGEDARAIAVNPAGICFVGGSTSSRDFPIVGLRRHYTYLGGPAFDFASGVAVDKAGNIFVVGQSASKNFPTTPGAPKRSTTGTADGYVVKISP
jgi:hypothetical protein